MMPSRNFGRSFFRSALLAGRGASNQTAGSDALCRRSPRSAPAFVRDALGRSDLRTSGRVPHDSGRCQRGPLRKHDQGRAGTYNGDVTISKSLTLLGGQAVSPGETGPSIVEYEATGFTVSGASKVTINGFTIEADPA